MAVLRASLASARALRSSASMLPFTAGSACSGSLHAGQRLAKPGLSGFSSNSSEQTAQTRIGNAISLLMIQPAEDTTLSFCALQATAFAMERRASSPVQPAHGATAEQIVRPQYQSMFHKS